MMSHTIPLNSLFFVIRGYRCNLHANAVTNNSIMINKNKNKGHILSSRDRFAYFFMIFHKNTKATDINAGEAFVCASGALL